MPSTLVEFDYRLPLDPQLERWAVKVIASAFKAFARWRKTGVRPAASQYLVPKPKIAGF